MKKTYKMFLALVFSVLGAMSVNAEIISLQEVPFCTWNGWGADAQKTGDAECAWVIGEGSGLPYGDSNVNNYADLSNFTKLIVTVSDGTPRFLLNRDMDEGQWNEDETQSHLIDNTRSGWSDRYFSKDGNTYIVDLKLLVREKGFAHLHAIKGANWANVTVESMEVERQAKAPQGWTSVIENGNFEGEEVTSFFVAEDAVNVPGVTEATISDGAGVDASRGLAISSMAGASETWATQLFVRANEVLPEGTKWRFSMDVRADAPATIQTGAHAEPRDWKAGGIIPEFNVDTDWTPITYEGTVDADLGAKNFQSIAFDLNVDKDNANTFYFDNINFEVFKLGTVAEFNNDVILLDFGFDTNMSELVKKGGKVRLMYPMDCVTVKVNGNAVALYSVEGFADGRFYIFLEEAVDETDEVEVSFTNPQDEAYRLIYASGAVSGQAVSDFTGIATNNPDVEENDGYPYDYLTPVVLKADPEDGSFNLPNSIKEFKLTFDKDVDCEALTATINGNALSVTPADGFASEITLTRAGDNDLATGEYTINVTKIYPKLQLDESIYGDTTYVINVGKPVVDPDDVPTELIPAEYFANCAAGSVPEGFVVYFGEEARKAGGSYGSGSRMFDFAAGGDFTKGLYFRDKYTEYGAEEGYALTLEAGKKYNVHFNSAAWKDNGTWMKFQLLDSNEEVKIEQVVKNAPNVNGSTAAVNGSTSTVIKFVPDMTGDYRLRWYPATDENGTEGGFNEVLLANVGVKYIPNTAGIEWVQLLNNALEEAKSTLNANLDERYSGIDFETLSNAIAKYEAEMEGYTAPSAYQAAADVLAEATQALKDHRLICDDYDTQIKKTIDVARQNAANKFATTELYAQLVDLNAKYHATSEWRNVADTIANPGAEEWQLFYSFDVLTDNDALNAAIAELKDIANVTSLLFTEGVSAVGGSNNGKGTGVAVLVDRIRLGVEGLKQLGVPAEDELIQLANNALTDDDEIVDALKQRMTLLIYERLQDPNNDMFKAEIDTTTFEEIVPSYDLTVFAKNPNIYKLQNNMNFTEENVPGWVTPEGYNKPGLSVGWGQPCGIEGIAEDCMFQTWGGSYRVEQTVTDLPAGVYTIRISFGERMTDDAANFEGSYAYVNTSDVAEGEIGAMMDCPGIGQSFPFASDVNNTGCVVFPDIVVVDGQVTFGVNAGSSSHTFFNDVRILMSGAAAGVDYQQAYNDYVETGIEAPKATTVRGIELYDLNGRRITSARQGVVIVKKYMSDGTVRTEKVVKK